MVQAIGCAAMIKAMRGVGFRIATLTVLLVMLVITILGAVNYSYVGEAALDRVKSDIQGELASLRNDVKFRATGDLAAEVKLRTDDQGPRRFYYHLAKADGTSLAGNTWLETTKQGWHQQDGFGVHDSDGDLERFIVLTTTTEAGDRLAVARGIHWIDEVKDELLEIMSYTVMGGLVLSILSAALVNFLIASRINRVNETATAIMNGDLSQRMPLTGAEDQFDRLSQTLNAMLERLSALMENLEQVSNDIAHDLRTPLSRLRQGLEQAKKTARTSEAFEASIDRAIEEAEGLLATFTSLLRIAQIDAGVPRSGFGIFDLSAVAARVVEAYEPSVAESGRHLKADVEPRILVSGDRDLMTQAMSNLIENALTHTPSGSTIQVRIDRVDGRVRLRVSDDGAGIPEAEREKVLQRFYRLEASRTMPGTGLGLSMVASVARLHDAHIVVGDNRPGLAITLTMPAEAT